MRRDAGKPVGEIFGILQCALAVVKPFRRIEHWQRFWLLGKDPLTERASEVQDHALIRELVARTEEGLVLRQYNPCRTVMMAELEISKVEKIVGEAN